MSAVLVIGASRGIGHEFVRQYIADGHRVVATARGDDGLARIEALGARALKLDVADAAGDGTLAWSPDGGKIDIAIYVAGVYGPSTTSLEPPTQADFDSVMRTNVLGAMRVLPQLAERLAPNARVAVISSRMGSIGSRTNLGGWLYRASKAAVNSVLKDVSLAMSGRATCVALHPGWVRTDMGGGGADLDVVDSVADMRRTLGALTATQNGSFLNHDGRPIDW